MPKIEELKRVVAMLRLLKSRDEHCRDHARSVCERDPYLSQRLRRYL
jgi:hypothetical protein